MNPTDILFPTIALALWTLCVLLLIPYQRIKAGRARQVTADDFKYGESERVPPEVSIPNRNMMNLLELPLLFYVACLAFVVSATADALALKLAWTYVALRMVHSLIHLSYNKVYHRLAVFALSNFVLVGLWLRLAWTLS
jgi:hypothetical protein